MATKMSYKMFVRKHDAMRAQLKRKEAACRKAEVALAERDCLRGVHAQKGFLTNSHLKQLAIYKGVYENTKGSGTPNKMQLLKPLLAEDTFKVGDGRRPTARASRLVRASRLPRVL